MAKKIIIVEDDPDILYLATKKLTGGGYEPISAPDGVAALHRMIDHPDCRRMLTDFVMPLLGGSYWIKLLERFCSDWTIVVVSSENVDPGPFIVVPKPVDYENILHAFDRTST